MLTFLIGLAAYVALDYVWINFLGKEIIHQEIGHLLTKYPDLLAGAITWSALTLGLYVFALQPATGWLLALVYGGLFGLVNYTIYEGTNKALIQGWTWRMAIFDIAWGCIACGVVNLLMYLVH